MRVGCKEDPAESEIHCSGTQIVIFVSGIPLERSKMHIVGNRRSSQGERSFKMGDLIRRVPLTWDPPLLPPPPHPGKPMPSPSQPVMSLTCQPWGLQGSGCRMALLQERGFPVCLLLIELGC